MMEKTNISQGFSQAPTRKSFGMYLIQLSILTSIFAQIDVVESIMRAFMLIAWMFTFIYFVIKNNVGVFITPFTAFYTCAYMGLFLFCCILSLGKTDYLHSNYLSIMLIPLSMCYVGNFLRHSKESIQPILKTYLCGAIIFAIFVHITYFPSISSWLKETTYVFAQKNSAAQIWGMAILIDLFLIKFQTKKGKIFRNVSALYLIFLCAISQCRTALLALSVVCFFIFFKRAKRKGLILVLAIVGIAILSNIPVINSFFRQVLALNRYGTPGLDTFSSGRITLWRSALTIFSDNLLNGVGRYYVDCSYLCILAELGIIGFLIVEAIWTSRIFGNFRYKKDKKIQNFLRCATLFYIVVSIFEAYPPFGPGVSSFMFWLLSAALVDSGFDCHKTIV